MGVPHCFGEFHGTVHDAEYCSEALLKKGIDVIGDSSGNANHGNSLFAGEFCQHAGTLAKGRLKIDLPLSRDNPIHPGDQFLNVQ